MHVPQVLKQSVSSMVRDYVRNAYIKPALQKGEKSFKVNVGAVHRALGLTNRVPLVCEALRSRKFLEDNELKLVEQSGPPSGQSTTVTFTYEITKSTPAGSYDSLLALHGIAKDVFQKLGGGEAFIRQERSTFSKDEEKTEQ